MKQMTQEQKMVRLHSWTLVKTVGNFKIYRRNANSVPGIRGPKFVYEVTKTTTQGHFYSLADAVASIK